MENEIIKYEDFKLVEKITPIAQLLRNWGYEDTLEDCKIESIAVFKAMGKILWEVYNDLTNKMMDWQSEIEEMIKDKKEDQESKE